MQVDCVDWPGVRGDAVENVKSNEDSQHLAQWSESCTRMHRIP
jgi:hypothetical protein